MGRRSRKQIMAKQSFFTPKCFFDGITLMALHDCIPPYELSPEHSEELEQLQKYLRNKSYLFTVWVSQKGWENFLKYVIERGKEEKFFGELQEKIKEHAGDLYLTYDCYLKTAKSLTRWDW